MLSCLLAQRTDEPLHIVVIDDGSTDGTAEFLRNQPHVERLEGDGSLWWGGAIDLGIKAIQNRSAPEDWVLFVNNDTHIEPDFVQTLLDTARNNPQSAVGSTVRNVERPHELLSVGAVINPWRFKVQDAMAIRPIAELERGDSVEVDALSGRGVLFPLRAVTEVRGMRPRRLPHYLADYELSLRIHRAGWKLLVSMQAPVYSSNEFGNSFKGKSLREVLFSVRSPSYVPANLSFWWSASNLVQKMTLPARVLAYFMGLAIKK
ncbi:hypothetical protein GWL_46380 [Herbaspirillum sp. GW103]|nr:hypothetical protein GWL_46380 [Herbaspirillum sp. GW103]